MIKAVVFDLDGTLYPEMGINLVMFPEFLKNIKFFLAFKKVRKEIRVLQSGRSVPSSRDELISMQVEMLANYLGFNKNRCEFLLNKIYYGESFSNKFRNLKPYFGVRDLIYSLKSKGIKLGVMSDFPIATRVSNLLRIEDSFWDVLYSSEDTGYLKPNKIAFLRIIDELGIDSNHILYVGNSYEYDILGASGVRMRTAYLSKRRLLEDMKCDFIFSNYKDLQRYILLNI
ncbi:HAD family hydrolase [Borrelia hermsii]|uniref:phosphoglycolate phosphatase n=3 Tax=Borrelia hermsii TaxID=140 RepID=A0AAN0X559_BORHE|nr:HAD family hydrolase [Borrelia hermsii]AAX17019.1 phosphocarrier protein HPr-phosphatase [Borrelia hermsii DAH]AJW73311.1 haloacid dehalogenase [Borrelia hermsii CC1]AMR75336.1 Hydrolase (HAD superfamily) [Borrelia hermsii]ANA43317.1 haloacid dehalogenase [Borrelia hermsii HS1]UCP01524.1 HAD family hydrolase [Borrelia hermsii]